MTVPYVLQGMLQKLREEAPLPRLAGFPSPAFITLPSASAGRCWAAPARRVRAHAGGAGQDPAGCSGGRQPRRTPAPRCRASGASRVPARAAGGSCAGAAEGLRRTAVLLPCSPRLSLHYVPTVTCKRIHFTQRQKQRPALQERALRSSPPPACCPSHFSHSLCKRSKHSVEGLQVLKAAAIPMATIE